MLYDSGSRTLPANLSTQLTLEELQAPAYPGERLNTSLLILCRADIATLKSQLHCLRSIFQCQKWVSAEPGVDHQPLEDRPD